MIVDCKTCKQCSIEKPITDFGVNGKYIRNICKLCTKNNVSDWFCDNKGKVKAYHKKYNLKNSDKIAVKKKKYNEENKERARESSRVYYLKNRDKLLLKKTAYNKNNRDTINKTRSEWNKRKASDPMHYLKRKMRRVIGNILRLNNYTKNSSTYNILGCTIEEFKTHLESKFEPWMNWDNRGLYNGEECYGWDIDHIIPIASAETEDDIIRLNHYTNLQPLCSYYNRHIKRDFYSYL